MENWVWLIGTFVAAAAAVAAWLAVYETRKAVKAQIVLQLTNEYSAPEMLRSMLNLLSFYNENKNNFGHAFIQLQKQDSDKFKVLNEDRRRCSHYFHKIERLLATGTVNEGFVKRLIKDAKNGQVDFLLDVIEPLEKALNPDCDRSTFDAFRKIYKTAK